MDQVGRLKRPALIKKNGTVANHLTPWRCLKSNSSIPPPLQKCEKYQKCAVHIMAVIHIQTPPCHTPENVGRDFARTLEGHK